MIHFLRRTPFASVLIVAAAAALPTATPQATTRIATRSLYAIRALPTLPGGTNGAAYGINRRGRIVGQSSTANGEAHAVIWTRGAVRDLGTLGGTFSVAQAINARGDIVGYATTADESVHAVLWRDGGVIELATLGGDYSTANDINARGQIAGTSTTADGEQHAVLWDGATVMDLGVLPGESIVPASIAWAVNDRRQVVGVSTVTGGEQHAFLWEDGTMRDLGILPGGGFSSAVDVNRRGQIVGVADRDRGVGPTSGFVWRRGEMGALGDLPGGNGFARAINNWSQVVGEGTSATGWSHALLWEPWRLVDLGSLPGDVSSTAWDINELGEIVGESLTDELQSTAVVWTRRLRL